MVERSPFSQLWDHNESPGDLGPGPDSIEVKNLTKILVNFLSTCYKEKYKEKYM